MTPREIEYVRVTFAAVAPQAAAVAQLFYDRLFELDPRLRVLFRGDLREQGVKLMRTIGVAVAALERVETLVPTLRDMGARHAGYSVRERDYDTVAVALLWTLEEGLGEAFTREVREAWTAAYGLLAGAMKAGAAARRAA
jgi:nitric oxide dioxygenase